MRKLVKTSEGMGYTICRHEEIVFIVGICYSISVYHYFLLQSNFFLLIFEIFHDSKNKACINIHVFECSVFFNQWRIMSCI